MAFDKKKWEKENPEKCREYRKRSYMKSQTDPKQFLTKIYHSLKNNAKTRGIKFSITKQQVWELLVECGGKCQMTGQKLTMLANSPYRASIDRIDSNKGYFKANLQVVTTQLNYAMNDYSKEDFIKMCKAIARRF